MQQVLQDVRRGRLTVAEVPPPLAAPQCVLIENVCSLVSAGTEKMILDLSRKSLLGKARERPDHVRRVLEKIRAEGLLSTVRQVREKLDSPLSMGYSSAGVVVACGRGVQDYKPGDRVASNGPHAEIVCVPRNLCARVPEGTSFESASFAVLGAIALQGVRLSRLALGETALVIGLGLVGQLTVALLKAAGCRVWGTDPDPVKCELARRMGIDEARPDLTAPDIAGRTRALGADAVLITASTKSNAPVELAVAAVRKKGRVVLVGVVGLELDRRPLYFKEAELVVSCSYGPGRYDPDYEEGGRDYPPAHVRWTEQRNLQAVLDLIGSGRLDVAPLISHRFPIEQAARAYDLIDAGTEPYLGIVLNYGPAGGSTPPRRIELRSPARSGKIGIGMIGAGNFARTTLLPAVLARPELHPAVICSAGGVSAAHSGAKLGFDAVTTDEQIVWSDPGVQAVFCATRHDLHARQVLDALRAGKSIFIEKPLCIQEDELLEIERALSDSPQPAPLLMVGFNRRFAPAAVAARRFVEDVAAPLTVSIRMNVGSLPADDWTQADEVGGGRLIGEACHAIDLATFLVGAPPLRVFAESIGGPDAPPVTDDQCFMTLRHANGAISSIGYLAGGDRSFPKERIEIIGGGRIAVIDDFRKLLTSSGGRQKTHSWRGQDKGHRAEVAAFADALAKGQPSPIPWDELRATSWASLLAVRSLREGQPLDIPPPPSSLVEIT